MHANRDLKTTKHSRAAAKALEVGVDAGGTRTRAIVRDANETILARAEGGAANVHGVGFELAMQRLEATIQEALIRARATDRVYESVARLAVGAAGLGDPTTLRAVGTHLMTRFTAAVIFVTSDAEVALAAARAAAHTPTAIALIAGTGSIALGQSGTGASARAGGYGFRLGDEGSAAWIGRQALVAVERAHDGRGPATKLDAAMRRTLKCNRAGLRVAAHSAAEHAATLGALAPTVVRCADRGDAVARTILIAAGTALADLVIAVAKKLRVHGEFTACPFGGVVLGVPAVRRAFTAALRRRARNCRVRTAGTTLEIAVLELARRESREFRESPRTMESRP